MQDRTDKIKPLILCILDGFGIDSDNSNNAITQASMPTWKHILEHYPHASLSTSGLSVGLPEGQMGNSEVGHMTMGGGRIIKQDLPRINDAISDNSLENHQLLKNLIYKLKSQNKTCHLLGLTSDGGVHSHIAHIIYLAKILAASGVKTAIHAFLDGRDTAPDSAIGFIKQLLELEETSGGLIKISTISGRYFAMDRDKRWDRIELAYLAIVEGKGKKTKDILSEISHNYVEKITDEFIKPMVVGNYQGMEDGDGLIMANFRADRVRQILTAILDPKFNEFNRSSFLQIFSLGMTEYSEELNNLISSLFPTIFVQNSLPEIIANAGLTQLRIAETEKYAHVTFFFNCGQEHIYQNEERILIPSPKVRTYDLQPEMSASEITEHLIEAIESAKYDLIVVNYANSDMVGHTGNMKATIKALEVIDECLGKLLKVICNTEAIMLVTSDHGNAELMRDPITDNIHTAHTTNPVPFVMIGKDIDKKSIKLRDGALYDIAPSILHIMGIDIPHEMSGKTLLI